MLGGGNGFGPIGLRVTPSACFLLLVEAETGRTISVGVCVCVLGSGAFLKQGAVSNYQTYLVESNHKLYRTFTIQTLWHKSLTSANPPSYGEAIFFSVVHTVNAS